MSKSITGKKKKLRSREALSDETTSGSAPFNADPDQDQWTPARRKIEKKINKY